MCVSAVQDLERHDGSADRPYYMSQELMSLLGKKNHPDHGGRRRHKKSL